MTDLEINVWADTVILGLDPGIQNSADDAHGFHINWIPAFAGMTVRCGNDAEGVGVTEKPKPKRASPTVRRRIAKPSGWCDNPRW